MRMSIESLIVSIDPLIMSEESLIMLEDSLMMSIDSLIVSKESLMSLRLRMIKDSRLLVHLVVISLRMVLVSRESLIVSKESLMSLRLRMIEDSRLFIHLVMISLRILLVSRVELSLEGLTVMNISANMFGVDVFSKSSISLVDIESSLILSVCCSNMRGIDNLSIDHRSKLLNNDVTSFLDDQRLLLDPDSSLDEVAVQEMLILRRELSLDRSRNSHVESIVRISWSSDLSVMKRNLSPNNLGSLVFSMNDWLNLLDLFLSNAFVNDWLLLDDLCDRGDRTDG